MRLASKVIFGRVKFKETEEYEAFRFRFLCVVLLSGAVFTALFIVGNHSAINPISALHVRSMTVFTTVALILWLILREHPERFYPIAWTYESVCLLEYISALAFVPEDELRVLWFMVNIPGVFILLGQRVGTFITGITVVGLAVGNEYLSRPYSSNAMATLLVSCTYLGVFFYVYGDRSISYFLRMRHSNEKLRFAATHDTLTGVMNARAYYSACDNLIRLSRRNRTPFAVLFIDLDHFKSINDTYGHVTGDIVLKSVAKKLSESIRESDALGRIGGEEFSILLPNTDKAGAEKLGETIRESIEGLMPEIGGKLLQVTASVGVAVNQHSEQTMLEIQQQADQAMYRAKAAGRNRVSTFDEVTLSNR